MRRISTAEYYSNAAIIFEFFKSVGLLPEQAAGMLAQADAESSLDPKAVGDHGEASGLFQLHGIRADAIKAGCGIDIKALPDVLEQCKGVWFELQHSEKRALAKLREATLAYEAGFAACKFFERPGAPGQPEKRGNTAEKWLAHFQAPAA
jgi:hypothetical protein